MSDRNKKKGNVEHGGYQPLTEGYKATKKSKGSKKDLPKVPKGDTSISKKNNQ